MRGLATDARLPSATRLVGWRSVVVRPSSWAGGASQDGGPEVCRPPGAPLIPCRAELRKAARILKVCRKCVLKPVESVST